MRKLMTLITAALLIAACSSQGAGKHSGAAHGLAITATLVPDPPRQGPETLTVTVRDDAGSPVEGAAVTVNTSMPAMSMMGPLVVASAAGGGTYKAHLTLQYATKWRFSVTAKSNGRSATSELITDVK